MVPNGLAMISPAPRQASAQAMTQDSARVSRAGRSSLMTRLPLLHVGLVLVLGHVEVALAKASHSAGRPAEAAYSFWNASSRP